MSVDISVIVPTYNRARLLPETVESLLGAVGRTVLSCEIILVDNASTDGTADLLAQLARAHPNVRCFSEPRSGVSRARNRGAAQATGTILAFTDDDARVSATWLDEVGATFREYGVGFAGGPTQLIWSTPVPEWLEVEAFPGALGLCYSGDRPFLITRVQPIGLPFGANMAVRRAAFERVGGFDVAIGPAAAPGGSKRGHRQLGEDRDICFRLLEAGFAGVYNPTLRVSHMVHPERLTMWYCRRWRYVDGQSQAVIWRGREPFPCVLGVPRYLIRQFATHLLLWLWYGARGNSRRRFTHEGGLAEFAGYVSQRWFGRGAR